MKDKVIKDLLSRISNLEFEVERLNKRIKELEEGFKATTEDLCETTEELEKANNVINELEKWLKGGGVIQFDLEHQMLAVKDILNKLQELKGEDKE